MIRKIQNTDREFFLSAADEFYHTDAVEKPLPAVQLKAVFEEIMRSDVYLEGFIFECGGERAGYSVIAKTFHTEAGMSIWIEDIFILPQYRGRGLGGELFAYLDKNYAGRFRRFRLEAEPENKAAVRLYEKNGFRFLPYSSMVKDIQ